MRLYVTGKYPEKAYGKVCSRKSVTVQYPREDGLRKHILLYYMRLYSGNVIIKPAAGYELFYQVVFS